MAATVTLNIFSGRPNPRWILEDAAVDELRERIFQKPELTASAPPGSVTGLGYRGLEVRFDDSAEPVHIHGGVVGTLAASPNLVDTGREVERFILKTMPDFERAPGVGLDRKAAGLVRERIERNLAVRFDLSKLDLVFRVCPPNKGACAPKYEPAMWNFSPTQSNNNCYNYANDRVTNTFAQPGKYHNAMYTALNCASVQPAAEADGLTSSAGFTKSLTDGYYVALVIWPDVDFHWYRQDKLGCWSHKPGGTAARNTDEAGKGITDPKSCDRGDYTVFCSYMITRPCKVRIK
jgi:hypothetical protein